MNAYTMLDDGSLLFDQPIDVVSNDFMADPANPRRVIPNWPNCTRRTLSLRVLGCGRIRGTYGCDKLALRKITFQTCKDCNVKEQGLQPASAKLISKSASELQGIHGQEVSGVLASGSNAE